MESLESEIINYIIKSFELDRRRVCDSCGFYDLIGILFPQSFIEI